MRKKRFLIPLIIILLILSTVIFIFFHNLNRFKDPNVVTPFIEQKLKIPVTIEKIDLNILGELQIKGLALYETEKKNSEEKIVFINKTIIKFNIAKILEKNFSGFISSIDIRKPEVFVN